MNKTIFALLAAFVMLLSACGTGTQNSGGGDNPSITPKSEAEAPPEGSISFEIVNNTGGDIYEAYTAAAETEEFGGDLLKERIIKAGASMTVHAMPVQGVQYYDLKALREDGDFYTWLNVPVGEFKKINLTLGDEGPEFTTE